MSVSSCEPHPSFTTSKSTKDTTYVQLIAEAIMSSHSGRMLLCEIYSWIEQNSPKMASTAAASDSVTYETQRRRWKNSVRHNLSLNECFEIDPSVPAVPHKGNYWRINPAARKQFECGNFARRRARQAATRHTRGDSNSTEKDPQPANRIREFQYAAPSVNVEPSPASCQLFRPTLEIGCAPISALARVYGEAAFSPREIQALRTHGYRMQLGPTETEATQYGKPTSTVYPGFQTFTDEMLYNCIRVCEPDYQFRDSCSSTWH